MACGGGGGCRWAQLSLLRVHGTGVSTTHDRGGAAGFVYPTDSTKEEEEEEEELKEEEELREEELNGMTGKLTYLVGDATEPVCYPAVIAHVCNDIGRWGSGFVLALSRKWYKPEDSYRQWHRDFQAGREGFIPFALGQTALVWIEEGVWVANMIGQHGVRSWRNPRPVDYAAIDSCLGRVAELADVIKASVHMPRIGCDRGGGTWTEIEPIIVKQLCAAGIDVYVYDLPK